MNNKKVLLVEPNFPIPKKSKNHKNFLPIGLLKLASYLRENDSDIKLVRGIIEDIFRLSELISFNPDEIWVTSLFTYWSQYVKETITYYKGFFPNSKVIVGGIYASLMPDHCKNYTGCDEVFIGIHNKAEKYYPAYDLVNVDYQIIHASRGCIRKCKFCGVIEIEPVFLSKKSIAKEIKSNKLIFYDNNLLANECIENILEELQNTKFREKVIHCECQSGFDGRLLTKNLAKKIKQARFINPRIAWDNSYDEYPKIEKQLNYLITAGFNPKDIYVFMVYNYVLPFEIMEKKRLKCMEWGVQIADCRYRPLNQTYDFYNPFAKTQTVNEYFVHEHWSDSEVRQFRKNVREQNICIRHGFKEYNKELERKGKSKIGIM